MNRGCRKLVSTGRWIVDNRTARSSPITPTGWSIASGCRDIPSTHGEPCWTPLVRAARLSSVLRLSRMTIHWTRVFNGSGSWLSRVPIESTPRVLDRLELSLVKRFCRTWFDSKLLLLSRMLVCSCVRRKLDFYDRDVLKPLPLKLTHVSIHSRPIYRNIGGYFNFLKFYVKLYNLGTRYWVNPSNFLQIVSLPDADWSKGIASETLPM